MASPVNPSLLTPGRRAGAIIVSHSANDAFGFILVSILPLLAARLQLETRELALLIALGPLVSGVVQPIAAWIGDRFDTRAFAWVGLLLGSLGIAGIPYASSFGELITYQFITSAGVGVFHPPAAALVGTLAGSRRALWLALFFIAGMAGSAGGSLVTPEIIGRLSEQIGVDASIRMLTWTVVPGVVFGAVVLFACSRTPHRDHLASDRHRSLPAEEQSRRYRAVGLLYLGNVLRFTTNQALVFLVVAWSGALATQRAAPGTTEEQLGLTASILNGQLQAGMPIGMGVTALLIGARLRPEHERAAMVLLPLVGAVSIAVIPLVEGLGEATVPVAAGLVVISAAGFGGLFAVSMGIAQRLLPHRTALASGMMLGGAWCLAFVGPLGAEAVLEWTGLRTAFVATAVLLAASGAVSAMLPRDLLIASADRPSGPAQDVESLRGQE
ncbi:MAG: MFS transporter [Planctomycetota bacterium]